MSLLRCEITELVRSDEMMVGAVGIRPPNRWEEDHGYSHCPKEEMVRAIKFDMMVLSEL